MQTSSIFALARAGVWTGMAVIVRTRRGDDVAAICVDGRPCGGSDRHFDGEVTGVAAQVEIKVQTGQGGMDDPALDGSNQIQDKEIR